MIRILRNYRKVIGADAPIAFFILLFAAFVISRSPLVLAATDGTLSSTSTGELGVSLSISNLVRITDVAPLNFGSYSGSGSAVQDDSVCVYTNNPSGQYKITARGSGTLYAFTITNGSTTIPYTVRWNNTGSTSGNFQIDANIQSSTLSGASTTSQTCAGVNNANFQVTMTRDAILGVPSGTYTGTLTLIIDAV